MRVLVCGQCGGMLVVGCTGRMLVSGGLWGSVAMSGGLRL